MQHLSRPLALEILEDRTVPATFGNAWIDPTHLTVSFAPDGTAVGGQTSTLGGLLGQTYSPTAWKAELLRAVQTWAAAANLNVGVIADGGAAFGSSVLTQGDRFQGDLRFGAVTLSPTQLALSHPFQPAVGSWSGDILFNNDQVFGDGSGGTFDLFTVALQEVGHALGLGNSTDPASAMYDAYLGRRTGLSAGDVAAIQALYGARPQDAYDAARSNGTVKAASALDLGSAQLPEAVRVTADLAAGDVDHYRFTAPVAGATTVALKTAGVSLLTGELTVLDAKGNVVGSAANTDPARSTPLTLSLVLQAGQSYTVRVRAAGAAFAVGGYLLEVTPPGTTQQHQASGVQSEQQANNTTATATALQSANGLGYSAFGTLYLGDVDYYKVTVSSAASQTRTLAVCVMPLFGYGATPLVEVYDAAGTRLAGKVIANQDGSYAIEVTGTWKAGQDLYVKVSATGPVLLDAYGLSVSFQATPTRLETMADLTLTPTSPQATQTLTVAQAELYHFVLGAAGPQATAAVRLTICDAAGNIVATLLAEAGQAVSVSVWLAPGTYTLYYGAGTSDGAPLQPLTVQLAVVDLSDSIDPYTVDPLMPLPTEPEPTSTKKSQARTSTSEPSSTTTTTTSTSGSSSFTYTTTSTQLTSKSSDPYADPYSDPYWF